MVKSRSGSGRHCNANAMKRHLEPTSIASELNEQFVSDRDELAQQFETEEFSGGIEMARALTRRTDRWIVELWQEANAGRVDAALAALGGYGRNELCLGSDVDLVLEVAPGSEQSAELLEAVQQFMTWARLTRVKLSHSVRTAEQTKVAFEEDFRTAVSYLDARPVLGEPTVSAKDAVRVLRADDEGTGFVGLLLEGYRQRLDRFGQTIYLLEPELKSGKGALRDVHIARWAALVRGGIDLDDEISMELGWSRRERAAFRAGHDWLLELRTLLHAFHGRKHDRLHFPDQERLAELLVDADLETSAAAETMMRRHYQVTRTVAKLTERVLRRWGPSDGTIECRIDHKFRVGGGQLYLTEGLEPGPNEVFEALRLAAEHDALLDPDTEERIEDAVVKWGEQEREDEALGAVLCGLLTEPDASRRTSTRLLELGLLPALVPEFEPVICHVQHDVYHVYTTDVHLVNCLEYARAMQTDGTGERERWPAFAQIVDEVEDQTVFLLAALFHDIGKNRGGGHSEKGAAIMLDIGPRLGLDSTQTDLLSFLVREHLVLSHTARRHDIADRRVIRDLAVRIRTVEALNQLTALTFCDMSTVGRNVMTDWNATLLLQLYQRLRAAIEHGVEEAWRRLETEVGQVRASMHEQVEVGARSEVDAFVRDLPSAYVVESPRDSLLRAFDAWRRGAGGEIVVTSAPDPERGSTEVIVSAGNIPGALAQITGAISSTGLNILDARIITTSSNRILDIFQVAQSGGASHALDDARQRAVTDERRLENLEQRLMSVLSGEVSAEALLKKRIAESRLAPRPTPEVETSVEELVDVSDDFTVVQIKAPDRTGLLYEISRTLVECAVDIRLSKIDSLGTQVIDTFYIETLDGEKLPPDHIARVCKALRQAVEQSELHDQHEHADH